MSARRKFDVITADAHVIVVDKPAGLLCIPGRNNTQETLSLLELLRKEFEEVYTVHRIDRDTSGLVIFARTRETHKCLSQQFTDRLVSKKYLALVKGVPVADEFSVDTPLRVLKTGKVLADSAGKASMTYFAVRERFKGYTLIEASPVTGRQHQIRVHLQYAGFPLIVDPQYHTSLPLTINEIKRNAVHAKNTTARPLLSRTPLHAHELKLQYLNGQKVHFTAQLPKDMRATINQLRKWQKGYP